MSARTGAFSTIFVPDRYDRPVEASGCGWNPEAVASYGLIYSGTLEGAMKLEIELDVPDGAGLSRGVDCGADYPVARAVQSALGDWISVAEAPCPAQVATLRSAFHLDLGESEAIVGAASNVPVRRGMVVIRTPLIYADAKILGLIVNVKEKLELRFYGFPVVES